MAPQVKCFKYFFFTFIYIIILRNAGFVKKFLRVNGKIFKAQASIYSAAAIENGRRAHCAPGFCDISLAYNITILY